MDNNQLNNIFGSVLSKLDPNNNLQIIKKDGLFSVKNVPNTTSPNSKDIPSLPSQHQPSLQQTEHQPSLQQPQSLSSSIKQKHTAVSNNQNIANNEDNILTSKLSKKNSFDTIFGKYFSNINSDHEFIINSDGVSVRNREQDRINFHRQHRLNEIVDAQLDNSERIYNSIQLQFVLFFISTLILIGFIFIINMSGDLSIFVVILLLIFLFLVFRFLRFNIMNFISNFRF